MWLLPGSSFTETLIRLCGGNCHVYILCVKWSLVRDGFFSPNRDQVPFSVWLRMEISSLLCEVLRNLKLGFVVKKFFAKHVIVWHLLKTIMKSLWPLTYQLNTVILLIESTFLLFFFYHQFAQNWMWYSLEVFQSVYWEWKIKPGKTEEGLLCSAA